MRPRELARVRRFVWGAGEEGDGEEDREETVWFLCLHWRTCRCGEHVQSSAVSFCVYSLSRQYTDHFHASDKNLVITWPRFVPLFVRRPQNTDVLLLLSFFLILIPILSIWALIHSAFHLTLFLSQVPLMPTNEGLSVRNIRHRSWRALKLWSFCCFCCCCCCWPSFD